GAAAAAADHAAHLPNHRRAAGAAAAVDHAARLPNPRRAAAAALAAGVAFAVAVAVAVRRHASRDRPAQAPPGRRQSETRKGGTSTVGSIHASFYVTTDLEPCHALFRRRGRRHAPRRLWLM